MAQGVPPGGPVVAEMGLGVRGVGGGGVAGGGSGARVRTACEPKARNAPKDRGPVCAERFMEAHSSSLVEKGGYG